MPVVHRGSLRLSLVAFGLFCVLAVGLGLDMPERYPVRFDAAGRPTQWQEGPGMWILLVAIGALSFGKGALLQRFLITDPNSTLLNLPFKELFHRLPVERKVPVVRRANRMLGLLNTGTILTFSAILVTSHAAARMPDAAVVRLAGAGAIWGSIALVLIVPLVELVGVRRMILRALEEEGLRPERGSERP